MDGPSFLRCRKQASSSEVKRTPLIFSRDGKFAVRMGGASTLAMHSVSARDVREGVRHIKVKGLHRVAAVQSQ
jgi:hypothetical protein